MAGVSRRGFLKAGAAVAAAPALEAAAGVVPHGRKNVLFIAVDDQNTSLGCYGNRVVKTPNLDALAARGVRFDKAYCQYPLCSPSRTSLMTGMAPDTTKIYDLRTYFRSTMPDVVTIPQLFRKNGYYAGRVGKIYHANVPHDIGHDGLDDAVSWEEVFNPAGVDHTKEEKLVTWLTPGRKDLGSSITFHESDSADAAMTDSLGADEVIRQLRMHRDKPFFLAYGLYRPHVSWVVPKAYFDMYPLETIEARPFDAREMTVAPRAAYGTHPVNFGMDEMARRQAVRAYYASTSFMDAQVGRVLAELKKLGLEDNTTVVFWADHGWALGEHGQWMKQVLFEPVARVPVIFAGAGVEQRGVVCGRTTEHLDIYPTLAELCGLQGMPAGLQGRSMVPLLKDASAAWDKPAVSQQFRFAGGEAKTKGYSIRTESFRYTSWEGAEPGEELYDHRTDPGEMANLAEDAKMAGTKAELKAKLMEIAATRGRTA